MFKLSPLSCLSVHYTYPLPPPSQTDLLIGFTEYGGLASLTVHVSVCSNLVFLCVLFVFGFYGGSSVVGRGPRKLRGSPLLPKTSRSLVDLEDTTVVPTVSAEASR